MDNIRSDNPSIVAGDVPSNDAAETYRASRVPIPRVVTGIRLTKAPTAARTASRQAGVLIERPRDNTTLTPASPIKLANVNA
jgi:hypothetical protein